MAVIQINAPRASPSIITPVQYSAVRTPPEHNLIYFLNLILRQIVPRNITNFGPKITGYPMAINSEKKTIFDFRITLNMNNHANAGKNV